MGLFSGKFPGWGWSRPIILQKVIVPRGEKERFVRKRFSLDRKDGFENNIWFNI